MSQAECPNRSTLFDYLVGKLPDDACDLLADHLESCPNCQAELATLSDIEDTLIGNLRAAAAPDSFLDESECSRAIAKAKIVADSSALGRPMVDASETTLSIQLGEYRLIQRLGSGGMGAVYKAVHNRLDRVVALKILPRTRIDDPKAIVRFEREMKAIGQLDDPHIVRAYDAREIEDRLVLVMEFVEGLDLGKIIRRMGQIDAANACELARQAAIGLQIAHEHGMVHRDVKPSNVMLAPEGRVKLLDLGLARFQRDPAVEEEMTGTNQAMGTADYMAPEQTSDSRAVDIRADIYGLGATLYKLLAGRAPFSGPEYQSAFEKMLAHRQTPPPPVRQFCPEIPEGLIAVLDRMLAKDPAARYSTPTEAAEALAPFCAGSDLPALLQQAEAAASSPLPVGEGQGEGRDASRLSPLSLRAGRALPKPLAVSRGWKSIVTALVVLLLVGGLGFYLGILIRINKDGKTTEIDTPVGSSTAIDKDGNATVNLSSKTPSEQTPQNDNFKFEIARVASQLAAQKALLDNICRTRMSALEVEALAANDPVTLDLLAELRAKKVEEAFTRAKTGEEANVRDINSNNKLADRLKTEVTKLQQRYDERRDDLRKMAEEKQESTVKKEIVKLEAQLASLREQPEEQPKTFERAEKTPPDAWLKSRIAEVASQLAVQKALLDNFNTTDVPAVELDTMVQNDPVAKQLSIELGWKKMDQQSIQGATKKGAKNGYADQYSEQVARLQKQYDERLKEMENKIREKQGSAIKKEIVKLTAQLDSLRQQPGEQPEAGGVADEKAIQGTWESGPATVNPAATINSAVEFNALKGSWKVVRIEKGKDADDVWEVYDQGNITVAKLDRLHFADKYLELVSLQDGSSETVLFRIDPATSPKAIDLYGQGSNDSLLGEMFAVGRYEVKGDRLAVRLARFLPTVKGNQRPTSVYDKPASGDILLELERYKLSKDEKAIRGNWAITDAVKDGQIVVPNKMHQSLEANFSLDYFNVRYKNGMGVPSELHDVETGVFALNPGSTPKSIVFFNRKFPFPDDVDAAAGNEKEKILGIYKFDADRLMIAYRKGDKPPEKFESTPGSGVTLLTLERPKTKVEAKPEKKASEKTPPK